MSWLEQISRSEMGGGAAIGATQSLAQSSPRDCVAKKWGKFWTLTDLKDSRTCNVKSGLIQISGTLIPFEKAFFVPWKVSNILDHLSWLEWVRLFYAQVSHPEATFMSPPIPLQRFHFYFTCHLSVSAFPSVPDIIITLPIVYAALIIFKWTFHSPARTQGALVFSSSIFLLNLVSQWLCCSCSKIEKVCHNIVHRVGWGFWQASTWQHDNQDPNVWLHFYNTVQDHEHQC